MKNGMMWILVVVALLVGAFGGYYYEKTKMDNLMNQMQMSMQQQVNSAKMAAQASPTAMMGEMTMMQGGVLTDTKGITLYVFDKDTNGTSTCYNACAQTWPAYLMTGTAPTSMPAHLGTTKRTDGSMQFTWDGRPLYYYSGDTKAGDKTGDGIGGIWHVVK